MNIGIVSLGLIGGSILKSLSKTNHNLYALTRNPVTIEEAKKYTKNISNNMDIIKECNVIFVASPINKTVEILNELEKYVNNDCIVLDCASVKEFVMKKRTYKFIGSHPMAGIEKSGFNVSFAELFQGAKWVITPFEDTLKEDIEIAESIIKLMGANVIITSAKEHDKAVALISHFPMLVSQSLMYMIKNNELAQQLASSGFRDMTRISMSNIEMGIDMLNFNSQNINFAIDELFRITKFLKQSKDLKILSDIKNMRQNMYSSDGKNIIT